MNGKRLLDVALVVPGIVLLAPLLFLLGLTVYAGSGAPVLFRQTRVGLHGREFRILKFRTMVRDAERAGPRITQADDGRITPVGRWMRRYKLDELPQLVNVLKGDMSLVGPRPEVPEYVALYSAAERREVLSVRPGITDIASIIYRDEERHLAQAADPRSFYVNELLPRKLLLAREYVQTRSLGADLRIIWRTLRVLAH